MGKGAKKRKREVGENEGREDNNEGIHGIAANNLESKTATAATSGFVHLLPPTPELWTSSLPHRTQVVYTPDYSYILQRLQVRPGSVVIEAGAGSGSFTHAAARAVFNGYPSNAISKHCGAHTAGREKQYGRVYSFEFHKQRFETLRAEIKEHGLSDLVQLEHRDVCEDGFMLGEGDKSSPQANAVFLDLPAPWLALKHLTRKIRRKDDVAKESLREALPDTPNTNGEMTHEPPPGLLSEDPLSSSKSTSQPSSSPNTVSPLNADNTIHICTFSPCIEQVQRTVSTLRALGWHSVSMVELSSRRIEVHRQRVGLQEEGLRGVNPSPANVEEAVDRLREVEGRSAHFHELERRRKAEEAAGLNANNEMCDTASGAEDGVYVSKALRLERIKQQEKERKLYKEGRLTHRSEPELKAHTSYLVFAFLPQEWNEMDEKRAQEAWPNSQGICEGDGKGKQRGELWKPPSKRQQKKALKAKDREEDRQRDSVGV